MKKQSTTKIPSKKSIPPSQPLKPEIFNPEKYINPKFGMTKEEVIDIKRAFDLFDEDGSGTINPKELHQAYQEMGMTTSDKMVYMILSELDQDNSGGLDFDEFIKLAAVRPDFKFNDKNELMKVFRIMDINKDGKISIDELKKICDDIGEHFDEKTIRRMIKKADFDDDGFVNFNDFCQILCGSAFEQK